MCHKGWVFVLLINNFICLFMLFILHYHTPCIGNGMVEVFIFEILQGLRNICDKIKHFRTRFRLNWSLHGLTSSSSSKIREISHLWIFVITKFRCHQRNFVEFRFEAIRNFENNESRRNTFALLLHSTVGGG